MYLFQGDEESNHPGDPINMSKISETVAKTACKALVEYLDLLASNGHTKLALRISSNRGQVWRCARYPSPCKDSCKKR